MQLTNVYPKFGLITIDDILDEVKDIGMLTPAQLKMLYQNCIRFKTRFDNINEVQYEKMGETEYDTRERKYFEVEDLQAFLVDSFPEALI